MKKRLFIFTLLLAFGFFLFADVSLADSTYGLDATAGAADLKKYGKNVPELIGNVVGTALSLVSVVFFILAVYGGFRMMLARGKEEEFTKGRDVLIHATIGLIIILASFAITRFVFDSVQPGGGGGGGDTPKADTLYCDSATPICSVVAKAADCTGTTHASESVCEDAVLGGLFPDEDGDKKYCYTASGTTAAEKCPPKGDSDCPVGTNELGKTACETAATAGGSAATGTCKDVCYEKSPSECSGICTLSQDAATGSAICIQSTGGGGTVIVNCESITDDNECGEKTVCKWEVT